MYTKRRPVGMRGRGALLRGGRRFYDQGGVLVEVGAEKEVADEALGGFTPLAHRSVAGVGD